MHIGLIAQSPWVLDAIEQWALDAGLHTLERSGLLVRIEGELEDIAHALKIDLQRLDKGWHTGDMPVLPYGVHAVSGLSTRGKVYPHIRAHKLDHPMPPLVTNGPHPGLTPSQVNAAYGVTGSEDGTGQVIALAEWGQTFQQSDVDLFCTDLSLPPATIEVVPIGGFVNTFNVNTAMEATLDVEWAHAMAPGATIRVYMAPGGQDDTAWGLQVTTLLNAVLTDSVTPAVLSISYGDGEDQFPTTELQAWEHLIAAITAKGTVVCVSSGDQGAYGLHTFQQPQIPRVSGPSSCPSALAVSATALFMTDLTLEDEWAWSNDANLGATGGGYSTVFARPNYQDGLNPQPTMRGVPDVSALGSVDTEGFMIVDGQYATVAGTSLSTPIVAGILTRITQAKGSLLGDIHAALYAHGGTLCRDITVGNNTCFAVAGFETQSGWDPVTGWGSPLYPQWREVFGKKAVPVISTANPATLTVAQLASGTDGAYGPNNIPLQEAARTVQTALQSATFFGFCHQPTGYFNAAQKAAFTLWMAGVRS